MAEEFGTTVACERFLVIGAVLCVGVDDPLLRHRSMSIPISLFAFISSGPPRIAGPGSILSGAPGCSPALASVIERRDGRLLCAGGTRDHVHLYLEPPGTLALCRPGQQHQDHHLEMDSRHASPPARLSVAARIWRVQRHSVSMMTTSAITSGIRTPSPGQALHRGISARCLGVNTESNDPNDTWPGYRCPAPTGHAIRVGLPSRTVAARSSR